MPEKDFSTWFSILENIPEPLKAAIAGAVVATIRIMYDDKEPRHARRLLEACLCGAIALCVSSLLEALGLPAGYSTFAGGSVGLVGADQVRDWARKFAAKRINDLSGPRQDKTGARR